VRAAAIFAAALALIALFTHGWASDGGSEASRFATIESLVERGTFAIDESTFADTVDRVRLRDHWFSDKPPLLSLAAAGVYAILHALGLSFRSSPRAAIWWMTLLVSGASAAGLAALFDRALARFGLAGRDRLLQAAAAVGGTLVFVYATTFSNHAVAALVLFAAAIAFLARRAFLAGLFAGTTAAIEIPVGGLFLVVLGGALAIEAVRKRRWTRAAGFAVGGAVPLALTALLCVLAYGDPRPAYLIPEAFRFEGSLHAGEGVAGIRRAGAPLAYALHALVGARGLLAYSPVLLLSIPAIALLFAKRDEPERRDRIALALGALATIVYYVAQTSDGGGWAFGFRFFTAISPILLLASAPFLARRRAWLAALLVPSALVAILGATNPWPVVDEGQGAATFVPYPRAPIVANLATAAQSALPVGETRDAAVRVLLGSDERIAYGYLGRAFANARDFPRALNCFRRAQRAAPNDPAIANFIAALEKR
jgi:hypothetical protein